MRILKKILVLFIFFIAVMSIVNAKSVIQVINQGQEGIYKVDTNYGFTFNMKNASTTTSNYHLISSSNEALDRRIFYDSEVDYSKIGYFYLDNENDCSSKNIYIMYNNVGLYHGNVVNLKITLNNCVFGYSNPDDSNRELILKSYTYNGEKIQTERPSIGFDKTSVQVLLNGLRSATLKYEFIDSNGKKINIKGYGTLKDLDYSQALKIESGIDKAYIYEDYNSVCTNLTNSGCIAYESLKHLKANTLTTETDYTKTRILENAIQSSNYETYSDSNYKYAWTTILFSGSEFELTYYLGEPDFLKSWWYNSSDYEGFGGGMYRFEPDSLIPFSIEEPIKSASKIIVEKNEEFTYKITHRVPYINKDGTNNLYNKYNIIDNFEKCFTIENKDITIKNDEDIDVTSNFDISISKEDSFNKINISAKSDFLNSNEFYGHEYIFLINTKVNEIEDLSKYKSKNSEEYIISNSALLDISDNNGSYTKKTNNVNITVPIKKQIIKVDDRNKYVSIVFVIIGISLIVCAILVAVLYKARNKYK